MITTRATKTRVFLVPRTPLITSMLGRDTAGPAKRSESAGPRPMPEPIRLSRIGISVRVAKYIKAPDTDAKKQVHTGQIVLINSQSAPCSIPIKAKNASGLAPTTASTYFDGIMAS